MIINRKIAYTWTGLVFVFIGAFLVYYQVWIEPVKVISERCINFDSKAPNILDCYGVISIRDGWDIPYLYFTDNLHGNYRVATISTIDQFIHNNGKIYVIDKKLTQPDSSSNSVSGETRYYKTLIQEGVLKDNVYFNETDIPKYLLIDEKTGEVSSYNALNDIPDDERGYFSELERRK